MEKIVDLKAREILDSRGDPTVEVELVCENFSSIASVPSGKSVGSHEAVELRDGDESRYSGMGVNKAVSSVATEIKSAVIGQDAEDQRKIDELLNRIDGTPHKSRLGANAILGVSEAVCKVGAQKAGKDLFEYIGDLSANKLFKMPIAMFKLLDGAKHADNRLEIQEYMVLFEGVTFKESYRKASEMFHRLKEMMREKNLGIGVGDEGGLAPMLSGDGEALKLIASLGQQKIALDFAGIVPKTLSLETIVSQYPVVSLEDPAKEDDFFNWADITQKYGNKLMLVGDDIFATNVQRLNKGFELHLANSVLIKPNQIGTISEAIEFVKLAKSHNYRTVVSHRSGETEDSFIADFAIGVGSGFVKFGGTCRGERTCKYNRMLRIEEKIGG